MVIRNWIILIFCLAAICLISSCRKDPVIVIPPDPTDTLDTICNTCDTCEPYPPYQGWQLGYNMVEDSVQRKMPCFNPNNADEILYVKEDNLHGEMSINTYNLATEEHHIIYTGSNFGSSSIYSAPKWGANDSIIFTLGDENVYTIKSDGTALNQITSIGQYHYPEFNGDADKFIIGHESQPFKTYIMDLNGDILDSVDFNIWDISNWNNSGYLITFLHEVIKVIDISNNSLVASYTTPIPDGISSAPGGIVWWNNSTILWSLYPYIFKSDLSFSNVEKAKRICDRKFLRGSINGDKTKIVWETYNYTYIDSQHLRIKMQIELMNPVTLEFETLELP